LEIVANQQIDEPTDWSCVELLSQLKMPQVLLWVNLKALNQSYLSSVIKVIKQLMICTQSVQFCSAWPRPILRSK
jgi:hypothetical protein